MKFNSAYPSLLGGVSQRPPGLRRPDQHQEQVNMLADPVRGLTRRQGSVLMDSAPRANAGAAATLQDAESFQELDLKVGATDVTTLIRRGAKPTGSALLAVEAFNRNTGAIFPVVQKSGDAGLALLEAGGASAAVALGRFLVIAGNTMTPTYTSTEKWSPLENQQLFSAWVRGGAYSRTFRIGLLRGNQKLWVQYTTRSASYPDRLDTSDLLATDPDYTKKVNDRTNEYNTRALRWAGEALADATPENIAERLAAQLRASGFLPAGTFVVVVGTTVCISDPTVEEIEVQDGGDGSLMRATGNVVGAPELLTSVGYPGRVVRILPTDTLNNAAFYVQAVAKDKSTGTFTAVTWEEAPGVLFEVTRAFALGTLDGGSLYLSTDIDWLETQTGVTFPRYLPSVTGDADSAGLPEFLKDASITMLGVFQDRLILSAGSTVNTSRTGDYLNFFPASLLDVDATDPVNFGIIGGEDDTLRRSVIYDRSLVLVGDKRHYVINGRQSLTPGNASATIFSHIPDTSGVQPVAAGNYLFAAKSAGGSVSLQQLQHGQVEETPNVQELTQDLDSYIAGTARSLVVSTTPDVVMIRAAALSSVYVYQFRDNGRERALSAWHRWDFGGPTATTSAIVGMAVADEALLLMRVLGGAAPQVVVERIALTGDPGLHPYLDLAHVGAVTGIHSALTGAYAALGAAGGYVGSLMGVADPTGAWYGFLATSAVVLTSPTMKAQEGIGRIRGDFTVGAVTLQMSGAGGVVYRVDATGSDPLTMAYGGGPATYPAVPTVGDAVAVAPAFCAPSPKHSCAGATGVVTDATHFAFVSAPTAGVSGVRSDLTTAAMIALATMSASEIPDLKADGHYLPDVGYTSPDGSLYRALSMFVAGSSTVGEPIGTVVGPEATPSYAWQVLLPAYATDSVFILAGSTNVDTSVVVGESETSGRLYRIVNLGANSDPFSVTFVGVVPSAVPKVVGPDPGEWAVAPTWGGVAALTVDTEPYDMDDYMLADQNPAVVAVTRTTPRRKSRLVIPVMAEANSYTLTLASYLWAPLSINGVEFDGRYFNNTRRIN